MINDRRVLAIIPARAGSKGVPGKNYQDLAGKPLISWSIEAAIKSELIDAICVTTNCDECAKIAKRYEKDHVITIRRPEDLCSATSRTEDAMSHAVACLGEKWGYVCLLQPTSPARPRRLIDRAIMKMIDTESDSVITVTSEPPFFWRVTPDAHQPYPLYSNIRRPMRQDLDDSEMFYHDNGNFYAVEGELLREYGRIGRKTALQVTTKYESMQIDPEEDFAVMNSMAEVYGPLI